MLSPAPQAGLDFVAARLFVQRLSFGEECGRILNIEPAYDSRLLSVVDKKA